MNKKYIITIIILLVIAVISFLTFNKTPKVIIPIEEVSPRNDTVSEITKNIENTVKSYSLAEVALHDKKEDCWIAIEGKVINPTQFIAEGKHPNDFILKGCGKDATSMFQGVGKHDGGKAQAALKQYEIGMLK